VFRRNGQGEEKSLREVIYDIKDELRDFAVTRVEMLKSELREKFDRIKTAIPLIAVGAVFAVGAFFALTFGIIAVIASAMPDNQWRWAIGAGVVFGLYAIIGGIVGWMGYREVTTEGLAPQRTLRVLTQDQMWIQNEARSA
jgi:uncharacterized membrane protein YqjE